MKKELQDVREDYGIHALNYEDLDHDAVTQFQQWLEEYRNISPDGFNAMTLSTVNVQHKPSSRVVLLKGITDGKLEFFTNYNSRKGLEMSVNPAVALCFFWPELQRQVRIEGRVEKLSAKDSETYFNSRPYGSKIGALASPQSTPISKEELSSNMEHLKKEFPNVVPKPEHWGGYAVEPNMFEFWQGRSNRMHDRFQYRKQSEGGWVIDRLAP